MDSEDRLAALEAKLQELVDRQAIFDCVKRNSRGNDRFDVDLVTSSYHPDGVHELGRKQISGREYGEHANRAHRALFDANLHNVTMHTCEIDGDVAHAESYSLGVFLDKGAETGRMLAGRYIDRLEKRDGEWRIVLGDGRDRDRGQGHPAHRRPAARLGLPQGRPRPHRSTLRPPADDRRRRPLVTAGDRGRTRANTRNDLR